MLKKVLKEGGKEILKSIKEWTKVSYRYETFQDWYKKLTENKPALEKQSITLSKANFEKALKQAFNAGRKEN